MKSLTKIILVAGIGLLTLLPFSLEAQKKSDYFKKHNIDKCISGKDRPAVSDYVKVGDTYCSSVDGKHYNKNVYTKSKEGKPFFLSKDARKYNKHVYSNADRDWSIGIHKQEQRYGRNKR
jgi:hypothetical protein